MVSVYVLEVLLLSPVGLDQDPVECIEPDDFKNEIPVSPFFAQEARKYLVKMN